MKEVEITTYSDGDTYMCRAVHLPTGLCVECKEFKGYFRNREKALFELKHKIKETQNKDKI